MTPVNQQISTHRDLFLHSTKNVEHFDSAVAATRSPIEALFIACMIERQFWKSLDYYSAQSALKKAGAKKAAFAAGNVMGAQAMLCQADIRFPTRRVILDFAFVGDRTKVNVELDGQAFHERTPEQALSDKSRDRLLASCGWTVLRFTGREVVHDVDSVCDEVMQFVSKVEMEEWWDLQLGVTQ